MNRVAYPLEIGLSKELDMDGAEIAVGFGTNMEWLHFLSQQR